MKKFHSRKKIHSGELGINLSTGLTKKLWFLLNRWLCNACSVKVVYRCAVCLRPRTAVIVPWPLLHILWYDSFFKSSGEEVYNLTYIININYYYVANVVVDDDQRTACNQLMMASFQRPRLTAACYFIKLKPHLDHEIPPFN